MWGLKGKLDELKIFNSELIEKLVVSLLHLLTFSDHNYNNDNYFLSYFILFYCFEEKSGRGRFDCQRQG